MCPAQTKVGRGWDCQRVNRNALGVSVSRFVFSLLSARATAPGSGLRDSPLFVAVMIGIAFEQSFLDPHQGISSTGLAESHCKPDFPRRTSHCNNCYEGSFAGLLRRKEIDPHFSSPFL
jgi:hypothetical protein